MALVAFSGNCKIDQRLLDLAADRLNKRQKEILLCLNSLPEKVNATQLVMILTNELNCPMSTLWSNLNWLRKTSLISYGNSETKGSHVEISKTGRLVIGVIGGKSGSRG